MPRRPTAPTGFRGRFLTDPRARAAYSEGAGPFRIVPAAVALPTTRADLSLLVRHAADSGWALTPRGAGSGMPGGNVGPGIIVDLNAFDRPARVALASIANVGAAVTWETINRISSHFGFRMAPDPSSGAFCTIGGMVATNAAGARSLRYGSIRPWVRGVEVTTADGECGWLGRSHAARRHRHRTPADRRQLVERLAIEERFERLRPTLEAAGPLVAERFPTTSKNAAGYALDQYLASGDLVDLVIGSEGTLAIVTRVELQLTTLPDAKGTMLLALATLDQLTGVVETVLAHRPVAVELLDRTFLDLAADRAPVPVGDAAAVLLVEFEGGSEDEVRDALAACEGAAAPGCLSIHTGLAAPERERLWHLRHLASPALAALDPKLRSLQVIEDGCVPVAALGRYLEGVRTAARAADIPVVAFGHAGDGHLHVNALVDATLPDIDARLTRLLEAVTALVASLGGTPSGEHGDGRLRANLLHHIFGNEIIELFGRVKETFDPTATLNPGVIVPTNGGPPLERLKVGPGAAPIPDPVAHALRRIERTAAWHTPRLSLVEEAS